MPPNRDSDQVSEAHHEPSRLKVLEELIILNARVGALGDSIKESKETSKSEFQQIDQRLVDLQTFLTGGKDPNTGILIRLDRVERITKICAAIIWTIVGACIIGAVNMVFRSLKM